MNQVNNKDCTGTVRKLENTFVFLFLFAVIATEIYRLIHWDFTWDESLTYIHFVKPIFIDRNPGIGEVIAFFRERTGYWCAMNNHLLHTFSMAACAKLFFTIFGYGNETVLRMPVIICFCIYIAGVVYLYRKKRISRIGVVLLCGSRYMMDFFALARGYSMAATFVFLACICISEWNEKPEKEWLVLMAVSFVTLGIVSQTVTFTIAAPIYLWLFIKILQEKAFFHFMKPEKLIPILMMVFINAVMLVFHFKVSAADHCMSPSDDKSLRSVMMSIFVGGENTTYYKVFTVLLWAFLICGWILFIRKKTPWKRMNFAFIYTVYIVIMSVITNTVRLGLPIARMLLPAYPVMALAIYGCINELERNIPEKIKYIPVIICFLAVSGLWYKQRDLSLSKEWPSDQGIKSQCYEALETQTKVYLP